MGRRVLTALALLGVLPASVAAAAGVDGRLDGSGARLLGEAAGDKVCLTLVEPRADPIRGCLLGARAGTIRTTLAGRSCVTSVRLLGIAPAGTVQVNLGGAGPGDRPVRLKLLRIPPDIHPGEGVAFAVRRSVEGTEPRLTAYDAQGRRLAQRRLRYIPFIDCGAEEVARPSG